MRPLRSDTHLWRFLVVDYIGVQVNAARDGPGGVPRSLLRSIGTCAALSVAWGCGAEEHREHLPDLPREAIEVGSELIFDPVPLTSVGGARGDSIPGHEIYLVRDALLLDGDGLVVADYLQRLLYFDGRGAPLQQVGGPGAGPGEFARIRSLHRLPDRRIAVWDAGIARVTVFDPLGDLAETLSLQRPEGSNTPQVLDLHSFANGGFVAVSSDIRRYWRPGPSRGLHAVSLLDLSGSEVARLEALPGAEQYVTLFGYTVLRPLGDRLHVLTASDKWYFGYGKDPWIVEYSPQGEALRRLLLPIERQPISDMDWEEWLDRFLSRVDARRRGQERRDLEAAGRPDTFPAFVGLTGVEGGSLWVRLYDPPGETRRWLAVDPATATAHPINLPYGAELLDAARDRVVLLQHDEFGREEVTVHRIVR